MRRTIRQLLRFFWRAVNWIYFRLHSLFWANHIKLRVELTEALEGERVIILAPHVDDDVIGCGGAILDYLARGKSVSIVYLTDGSKLGSSTDPMKITNERKKEAEAVANEIGLHTSALSFLNATDGKLLESDVFIALSEIINKKDPTTIFLPVALDTHIDHYAASLILSKALKLTLQRESPLSILYYEAQSPLTNIYCNISLNITKYITQKMELTKFYQSQPSDFRFVMEQGRANALAVCSSGEREIYLKMTEDEFKEKCKLFFGKEFKFSMLRKKLIPFDYSENHLASYVSSCREKKELKKF